MMREARGREHNARTKAVGRINYEMNYIGKDMERLYMRRGQPGPTSCTTRLSYTGLPLRSTW